MEKNKNIKRIVKFLTESDGGKPSVLDKMIHKESLKESLFNKIKKSRLSDLDSTADLIMDDTVLNKENFKESMRDAWDKFFLDSENREMGLLPDICLRYDSEVIGRGYNPDGIWDELVRLYGKNPDENMPFVDCEIFWNDPEEKYSEPNDTGCFINKGKIWEYPYRNQPKGFFESKEIEEKNNCRVATTEDMSGIINLLSERIKWLEERDLVTFETKGFRNRYRDDIEDDRLFVYEYKNEILGIVRCDHIEDDGFVYGTDFVTKPDHKIENVLSDLMEFMCEYYHKNLRFDIEPLNDTLHDYYISLGCEPMEKEGDKEIFEKIYFYKELNESVFNSIKKAKKNDLDKTADKSIFDVFEERLKEYITENKPDYMPSYINLVSGKNFPNIRIRKKIYNEIFFLHYENDTTKNNLKVYQMGYGSFVQPDKIYLVPKNYDYDVLPFSELTTKEKVKVFKNINLLGINESLFKKISKTSKKDLDLIANKNIFDIKNAEEFFLRMNSFLKSKNITESKCGFDETKEFIKRFEKKWFLDKEGSVWHITPVFSENEVPYFPTNVPKIYPSFTLQDHEGLIRFGFCIMIGGGRGEFKYDFSNKDFKIDNEIYSVEPSNESFSEIKEKMSRFIETFQDFFRDSLLPLFKEWHFDAFVYGYRNRDLVLKNHKTWKKISKTILKYLNRNSTKQKRKKLTKFVFNKNRKQLRIDFDKNIGRQSD